MSLCPWRVQARVPNGHFDWVTVVDKLTRKWADQTALTLARNWPHWEIRLLDDSTGEVVHHARSAA